MLKFALAHLRYVCPRNKGEDHIAGVSCMEERFYAQRARSINEDTCMLWGDHRFNDGCYVINIRERFNTEQYKVKASSAGGIFRRPNDYSLV